MKKYKAEDPTGSEIGYGKQETYSSKTGDNLKREISTTDKQKQETYTKEKRRRLSLQEFLNKYKLNGDVDKGRE